MNKLTHGELRGTLILIAILLAIALIGFLSRQGSDISNAPSDSSATSSATSANPSDTSADSLRETILLYDSDLQSAKDSARRSFESSRTPQSSQSAQSAHKSKKSRANQSRKHPSSRPSQLPSPLDRPI